MGMNLHCELEPLLLELRDAAHRRFLDTSNAAGAKAGADSRGHQS